MRFCSAGTAILLPRRPRIISKSVLSQSGVPVGTPGFLIRIVVVTPSVNADSMMIPLFTIPDAARLSLRFVWARLPRIVVVPEADRVSFLLVYATVPVDPLVTVPLAETVSSALVLASEPAIVVVPVAEELSFALVFAREPVTVVVPEAVLVSLAFV